MPKIIDYPERYDQVRAAVFRIVLEEGTAAVSFARVATMLDCSQATLKRIVESAAVLPALGLQWVSLVERRRWMASIDGRAPYELDDWERARHRLEQRLPLDPERRDEERVFRALVGAWPREGWAVEAAKQRREARDEAVRRLLDSVEAASGYDDLRLLVDGLTEAVVSERLEPDAARRLLHEHVVRLRDRRTAA
jgi:hypothetical protein